MLLSNLIISLTWLFLPEFRLITGPIISFFLLGVSILFITSRKSNPKDLLLFLLESSFISVILAVILPLVLSSIGFLNDLILAYFPLCLLMSLSLVILVKPSPIIKYSKCDFVLLSLLLFQVIVILLIQTTYSRLYTVDEYVYLDGSIDFLKNGSLLPHGQGYSYGSDIVKILQGRLTWQCLLLSVISMTSIQGSIVINIVFFAILGISSFKIIGLLSGAIFSPLVRFLIYLIATTSPLVLVLSLFILPDFAVASLSVLALYYFIKSFLDNGKPINFLNLLKSVIILIVLLSFKFNLILVLPIWFVLVIFFIRKKLYRLSYWYKSVFLSITLPVIVYELLFEIPQLLTYYVFPNPQLNSMLSRFVFISPFGQLINLFYKAPWTSSTLFDVAIHENISYFFYILTPELITVFVISFIALTPFLFRKSLGIKLLIVILFLGLILTYFSHISNDLYYDIQRNSLGLIILFQVIGLMALFDSINKLKRTYIFLSIVLSQIIILMEYFVLCNQNVTFILWGVPLDNGFNNILLGDVVITSLIVLPLLLSKFKLIVSFGHRKLLLSRKIISVSLVLISISSFMLINNLSFVTYGLDRNDFLNDHGVNEISSKILKTGDESLLTVSNLYSLPLYLGDSRCSSISPPLNYDDLYKLLKSNIGLRLVVSNDLTASWLSARTGQNDYLKNLPAIIMDVDKDNIEVPTAPIVSEDNILFYLSTINSSKIFDYSGDLAANGNVFGSPEIIDEGNSKIMHFDGINNQLIFEKVPLNHDISTFSIELWFKTSTPQNGKFILMDGYDDGTINWGIYLSTNSSTIALFNGDKLTAKLSGYFDDDAWHQIMLSCNGSVVDLYIDGLLGASVAVPSNFQFDFDAKSKLYIGSWSGKTFFEGYVGFIKFYEKFFDSNDVTAQYLRSIGDETTVLLKQIIHNDAYSIYLGKNRTVGCSLKPLIETASVRSFNGTFTTLDIVFNSQTNQNITLIVNTRFFSKIFDLNLKQGINNFQFLINNKSPSNSPLGTAIASKSSLIAFSSDGALLETKIIGSTKIYSSTILFLSIILLALFLFYLLLLHKENISS